MDEYYCPNCGATLNNQSGFDPDNGTWTCTQCGQHLMDDDTFEGDSYEGVAWYCDECGTLLNKQSGFSDGYGTWTCTECGHTNGTTEDDIYESEEDYQYQKTVNATADFISSVVTGIISGIADGSSEDDEDEDLDYDLDNETSSDYEAAFEYARQERELEEQKQREYQAELNKKRRAKQRRRKNFCKKHRKGIVVFVCIILLSILTAIGYYQYSKLIPTGYNDEELVGLSYEAVEEKLESAGFTNISTIATEDLTLEQIELESIVFEIKISDDTDFEKDKKYPYDTEIIVRYHAIVPVSSPVSSKEIKKQNYNEVQTQFKEAGFVNISIEPIYDVVLGWFVSDGEIESITVNGEDEFYKGEEFRPDDAVVIKYHTLKKNKPK